MIKWRFVQFKLFSHVILWILLLSSTQLKCENRLILLKYFSCSIFWASLTVIGNISQWDFSNLILFDTIQWNAICWHFCPCNDYSFQYICMFVRAHITSFVRKTICFASAAEMAQFYTVFLSFTSVPVWSRVHHFEDWMREQKTEHTARKGLQKRSKLQ